MPFTMRAKELKTRRSRSNKLYTLRKRYLAAKNDEDRTAILQKAKRVAMWLSEEEFLAPLKK